MKNLVKMYCQEKCCRYGLSKCCVAEISAKSLRLDPDVFTKSRCKKKNSIKVIGRPAA